jgi:hypothetical protein
VKNKLRSLCVSDRVQIFCILYISIWAISPPLGYGVAYRIAAVAATGLWVIIEMFLRPSTFFRPSFPTLCAIIFVIYTAILGYWIEGLDDIIRNLQIYICLLFLIIYESYKKRDIRQLRIIFWGALFLFPVWLYITLTAYGEVHNVSRLLTRSTGIESKYAEQGIGGFGLVYSILIGIPILLYLTKQRLGSQVNGMGRYGRWMFKGLTLLTLVLGCSVILKAGYSIAVALLVGGVLIAFFGGRKRSFKIIRLFFIVFIGTILLSLTFNTFVNYVETISRGTMYERKVHDVKITLTAGDDVGTVSLRTERYMRSIKLFMDNLLLGTMTYDDIGKHSAILDRFARYGFFIGSVFFYLILYLPILYIRKLSNIAFGMSLGVAFVSIGFAFLNNIFSSYGFMLFIFYPVAATYIGIDGERCCRSWHKEKPLITC